MRVLATVAGAAAAKVQAKFRGLATRRKMDDLRSAVLWTDTYISWNDWERAREVDPFERSDEQLRVRGAALREFLVEHPEAE